MVGVYIWTVEGEETAVILIGIYHQQWLNWRPFFSSLYFFLFLWFIFLQKLQSRWIYVSEEAPFARRCWIICTRISWPIKTSPILQSRLSSRVLFLLSRRIKWLKGRIRCELFFIAHDLKTSRSTVWIHGSRWFNNAPMSTSFNRMEIILLPTKYIDDSI